MALKVQRRASGLLSALGIVGSGDTPNALAELVSPTMDVQLFFDAGRHEIADASGAAVAAGDNVTITVPATQAWRVIGLSARFVAGVGAAPAPSFWCGVRFTGTGNFNVLGFHYEQAVTLSGAGGEEAAAPANLSAPFILGPGAQLRAQLATGAVAGSTLIVVAAIARYQA